MLKLINKSIFKCFFVLFLLIAVSLIFTNKANAASLILSPASSTVSVGNISSIKVLVNTEGKSINNTEASIQFSTDMLEVVSITKNSSIFSLWVEEPSFSNYNGKITFNGGVPSPGFNGSSGYISTIVFKAKKQGSASIIFSDGAVRENDGMGTDILTSKNSSVIQIGSIPKNTTVVPIVATPIVTVKDKNTVPLIPIIISATHPNQDVWYSKKTASFNWEIPSGVISIRTLINKTSNSVPTIKYDNSVTQKTVNNISDGTSYFHLRYFNSEGGSPVAHYKVKIDSTAPLSFVPTIRSEGVKNLIKLNAKDKISGIDYYNLKIDDSENIKVNVGELINSEYSLPLLKEGSHNIFVKAYDKAGNYTEANLTFVSSKIITPQILLSSKEVITGEFVIISGDTGYPNKKVEVSLKINNKVNILSEIEGAETESSKSILKYNQMTDADGKFSVTTDVFKKSGVVDIWAETVLDNDVKSQPSETLYLKVKDTKIVGTMLALTYPLISTIIVSLLSIIFIFILYLGWHKFFGLKKKIDCKLKNTAIEVHKSILLLKEELNNQLESLEKIKIDRNLNKKEKIIFDQIKNNIDDIDNFIEKKINKLM